MSQLGFLIVRDDPDIVERYDGDYLAPGMNVLPRADATSGLKIKNRDYSQAEGRGDLFNGPRQKPEEPYHGRLQR